ncbi:MAG: hypothetical protein LCH79_14700 [Proteobacteria bacterium]|jgi:hypothetical protein|nr:hypothetical protein [Ramlibacter sp.]MCA0214412.1 hypothetical protein [Pseudomonadota bacterium]
MKLVKTPAGQQALKDRSAALSPRQRSAFILFDGQRSTADVLAATQGLGFTQTDVEYLVGMGLLAPSAPVPAAAPAEQAGEAPLSTSADRYRSAYPLAAQLTAGLGLRGYRLNLAVEAATDDAQLLALLPRIQEAVGVEKCVALAHALKS